MSDEEIPMAQCGACNSIIPLDSESCPDCGVKFGEVSEQVMGECGECKAIIPADSISCPSCGAVFVAIEQRPSSEKPVAEEVEIAAEKSMDEAPESEPITDEEPQETESDSSDLDEVESSTVDSATEEVDESPIDEEVEEETVEIQSTVVEEPAAQVEEEEEESEEEVEEVAAPESDLDSSDEPQQTETISEESANEDDEEEVSEDTVSEDETVESMMDDLVDDLEETDVDESEEADVDESEEADVDESEEADEESEVEEEVETTIEDSEVVMAFENLALAIAAKGMTAVEAFGEMDSSEDNLIDAPELQKGIEKIAGEKLVPKHVTAILNYLDSDGDRRVDPNELVKALDDLRIGIQPGELPKVKTFPSPVQKFLMGKKANDILYPISYFLMVTFIGIWVVNGMGLIVDGSGGTVVYEGGTDQWGGEITEANWNLCESDAFDEMIDPCKGTVSVGETYPCDPALDPNKCQNSLTPFSGENGASSMPAGFYSDGIFMIILGVIGVAATAYLHLIYAPSLRERAKKGSNKEDDDEEDEEEEEDEEDSEEEDSENALEAPVDLEVADDEDDEDDSDEEEYDDDDIDVGDWIGLEIDGDEFFGEIIEFDDDEGTVTIETEDGEEITGDQEDMFLDDE